MSTSLPKLSVFVEKKLLDFAINSCVRVHFSHRKNCSSFLLLCDGNEYLEMNLTDAAIAFLVADVFYLIPSKGIP